MQTVSWDDIRFFLALARRGSVSQAAAALSVNYTTVARRIAALEERVDARLFERLPTGHVMTAAAEDIFPRAVAMEQEASALEREIRGQDTKLSGRLRLASGDVTLTYLVLPHIDRFLRAYPDIELEIASADEQVDLALREADIALRATYSDPPPNLVGIRLGQLRFAVFGSREYLRKHPELNSPDTSALCWQVEGMDPLWVLEHIPKAKRGPWFDSTVVMAAALRSGLGIGGLAHFVGAQEPELELVFPKAIGAPNVSLWLLHHPDLRSTAKVRVFRDFLKETLLEQRSLIVGP